MSIAVPLYGFGASGGTGGTLAVTAPANVTVTVSKDGKTKTKKPQLYAEHPEHPVRADQDRDSHWECVP